MQKILVIGAGRSATSLIHHLTSHADASERRVTVADRELRLAEAAVADAPGVGQAVALDAGNAGERRALIAEHDLVVSMLPASMHMDVVRDCIALGRHVLTPSYVPDEMWALDAEAKAAGIVILNELGLDPGIDHMSAMRILDTIRSEGGIMRSFKSYTGGLIAPESDDNPWGYKFTWNPRNVVLAGQGGAARFIEDGRYRYIPYHRLFSRTVRIDVPGYGVFDGYANRDSLKYRKLYGLDDIPTLVRGTLRKEGFCAAWDVFVQLGCTDDSYRMETPPDMSCADYFDAFLPPTPEKDLRTRMADHLRLDPAGPTMEKLDWLGVFSTERTGITDASPARILQELLERKWVLRPTDKDMIVMQHVFHYTLNSKELCLRSSLVVEGIDQTRTAMARTVGLPLAIAALAVLDGRIGSRGVLMPLTPEFYDPILDELAELGIAFQEKITPAADQRSGG